MDLTFRELQKECMKYGLKPCRGKGITRDVLLSRLIEAEVIDPIGEKIENPKKEQKKPIKTKYDGECPICLDDLNNKRVIKTKCGHLYHHACIVQMNKDVCPLCRASLEWPGCKTALTKIRKKMEKEKKIAEEAAHNNTVDVFLREIIEAMMVSNNSTQIRSLIRCYVHIERSR